MAAMFIHNDEQGLTLLELLVVVTILSAVAWMSLATVTNSSAQVRFEDSRNRLGSIRNGVLGSTGLTGEGSGMLKGYVVDNGLLPVNIDALVVPPVDYDSFALVSPWFDPTPTTDLTPASPSYGFRLNDGTDDVQLTALAQQLKKGHREYYVTGSTGGSFRDGWGNGETIVGSTGIDCPSVPGGVGSNEGSDLVVDNHGWCVTHNANGLYVDSYGMDGTAGSATSSLYEDDQVMAEPILAGDWLIDVTSGSVRIINSSGVDIDFGSSSTSLRGALLVYFNDADPVVTNEYNWRQVATTAIAATCLDGDGDGLCAGSPASDETLATFPVVSAPLTNDIPMGEHVLILVYDPDTTTAGDETISTPIFSNPPNTTIYSRRIKFYPRTAIPDMVFEIF